MKKQLTFLLLLAASLLFKQAYSQECTFLFPTKVGSEKEREYYDKKGKVTSYTVEKVTNFSGSGNTSQIDVEITHRDAKSKEINTGAYKMFCKDGKFFVDMSSYFDQSFQSSLKGMQATVTADNLEVPLNAKPGDVLSDGSANVAATAGIVKINMYIKVTNRKFEGMEKITCPAGTFDCYKFSFDTEVKSIVKIIGKSYEWYAKEVGLVKTESFDKKGGKLTSSLLTKIK